MMVRDELVPTKEGAVDIW